MGFERLFLRMPPGSVVLGKVSAVYESVKKVEVVVQNKTVMALYNSESFTLSVGDDVTLGGDQWQMSLTVLGKLPVAILPTTQDVKVV